MIIAIGLRILESSPPMKRGLSSSSDARMAELADALDSGSSLRTGGGGSSPPSGTKSTTTLLGGSCFFSLPDGEEIQAERISRSPAFFRRGPLYPDSVCRGFGHRSRRAVSHVWDGFFVSALSQLSVERVVENRDDGRYRLGHATRDFWREAFLRRPARRAPRCP